MMRMLLDHYAAKTGPGAGAAVSLIAHATLIAAAVLATAPPGASSEQPGWIANRVYYMPPPDHTPGQRATRETIKYIELAPVGEGAGLGPPAVDAKRPFQLADSDDLGDIGDIGRDTTQSLPAPQLQGNDSAFTSLEVDSAAVRDASSAAPAYPQALLEKGIEGSVAAQYVVDTTGRADTASFHVLRATAPEFAAAVRTALALMRFTPARMGDHAVRQLVEQEFAFKILRPDSTKTLAQRDSSARRRRPQR